MHICDNETLVIIYTLTLNPRHSLSYMKTRARAHTHTRTHTNIYTYLHVYEDDLVVCLCALARQAAQSASTARERGG